MLLGPPTQADLFAWGETTGPPRLSTPATLQVPHTAGPEAGASSQGHLNVWGMGWAWMCASPAPGLGAAATRLPPARPLLGQLAQPQRTRPGGGPLPPSLRGHACPGAPGTPPAACLPASRRSGPHPTPHYPSQPPRFQPCPHQSGQGHYQGHQPTAPSCSSLCRSRPSGHAATLRPACGTRS